MGSKPSLRARSICARSTWRGEAVTGGFPMRGRLDEVLAIHAFAHQASLHVGERDDDGVDLSGLDVGGQLLLRQQDVTARSFCAGPEPAPRSVRTARAPMAGRW